MASAGPPPTQIAKEKPEGDLLMRRPLPLGSATFAGPTFYITSHQRLSPGVILLAVVAAVAALGSILFVQSHVPANAAQQRADDDPDQVDVIILGAAAGAPKAAHPGDHVSPVHPTILVHLPRSGDQVGLIPNTPAGRLLYNWLGAFNQASYPALAKAVPNVALAAATTAQLELRRQTGGLSLLSAKEVAPGILVFRLRDQTPSATEVLGTLQVRPNSSPATIESFSLRAVPAAAPATAVASRSPASPQ